MLPALNSWTFPPDISPSQQIDAVAGCGLGGLELVIGRDGPLTPETPAQVFSDLAQHALDRQVKLVGLATGLFWEFNYASPEPDARRSARDLTLQMLDRAHAAQAGAVLVVPALVGKAGDAQPNVAYADALHRTLEALSELRFEAESRAVTIALENVWNRFLLSPVEAADLIDEINSPCVGFYFDVGNILPFGYPQDWIRTLGRRLARVHAKDYDLARPGAAGFCPLGDGSVDWPAIVEALHDVGYDGPVTYEGPGEPADIARRLRSVLGIT